MLKNWLAAVVIAGVVSGCGRHRINDDLASDDASTLQVVNHHCGTSTYTSSAMVSGSAWGR